MKHLTEKKVFLNKKTKNILFQKMNIIYTVRLDYKPFCDKYDLKKTHIAKLMAKKSRILKIIEKSLFGFDILSHYMCDGTFAAVICPNGDAELGHESMNKFLEKNYAAETWKENDIALGVLNNMGEFVTKKPLDYNLHTVNLDITLKSVEDGAQRLSL